MNKYITVVEGRFFCRTCDNSLTIISENGGDGFRARCSTCQKTYYYPACDICDQAMWKHDTEKCFVAMAKAAGKRYCRKCKTVKEIEDFNAKGNQISSRCKKCQSAYFKEWYEKSKGTPQEIQYYGEEDSEVSDFLDDVFSGDSKW